MAKPIIDSILDTDLYKLTMQQCVFNQYPNATARYTFKCRNEDIELGFLIPKISSQIEAMSSLSLTGKEKEYLSKLSFMKPDYLDYLASYRFNPSQVDLRGDPDGDLYIDITGPWLETILFEVPLLAIVNQLYFEEISDFREIRDAGERNLKDKINLICQYPRFQFADFGTRRRYSADWQRHVVKTLHDYCPQLIGTSNVKLAMDLGIKAIGTMAHEFISAHIALVDNIREAQKRAFYVWLQEYGTNLGIALTDTFTTKAFYQDFGVILANGFSGVRQDSGDVMEFGHKMIEHYKKLGIDPRTKSIVFSDGLDVPKAIQIYKEFTGLVGVSFGIGTNLTNNLGPKPLNVVIKMVECNGKPVVKLSDNVTKAIGDSNVINSLKTAYNL
jgi:nicotinate phosphoribosyltransferase